MSNDSRAPVELPGAVVDELDLPKPPGRIQTWMQRHPRTVDGLLMLASTMPYVIGAVAMLFGDQWDPADSIWTIVVAIATGACVLVRRRFPFWSLMAASAVSVIPEYFSVGGSFALYVLLYTAGSRLRGSIAWMAYGLACFITAIAGLVYRPVPDPSSAVIAPFTLFVVLLVPFLIGQSVGSRRRYTAALIQRAQDLARERDQRAKLAVSAERSRIAREMHDVVSHSLTVMVTLSEGAAAQAELGSDRAPAAMRQVAATGRESLAEMRRLLGVLRAPEETASRAPQPGDTDIPSLITRMREAGLPVVFRRSGAPLSDRAVELTAYRIIQEALTNVLRHAPAAASVEVSLDHDTDGRIIIDVQNAAAPKPPSPMTTGTGTGLIGIRERAAIHGGVVDAGPLPAGGWCVHAVLDGPAATTDLPTHLAKEPNA